DQPVSIPAEHASIYSTGLVAGGRATQVLFGPRVEARGGRFGYFLSGKVGALHWSDVDTGYKLTTIDGSPVYDFGTGGGTYLTVQPTVGLEYSISNRVRVRGETGTQLVHYHHPTFVTGTNGPLNTEQENWIDRYTASAGIYAGVGRSLRSPLPQTDASRQHRFLDKSNRALFLAALLGQAADAITTQRFLHHGIEEQDVFAKPLVDQGWGGQVGLVILTDSVAVSIAYGLHRIGAHWAERLLPAGIAAGSGYLAYNNLHLGKNNVY
ncbi:MAG: hypothetical protein ACRYFU_09380, partial [Janthinobacterium lividum]